jgi:transcriptional regulator with XRE-family HTH domain
MDMRKTVGTNFMRLRKARGLTQEQVAETSGYGQNYISSLERGRRNPTVITLFLLAEAVGSTPRDLVAPIHEDAA